jgi:hypothetical protein
MLQLPRWARVALATRCVQRVLGLRLPGNEDSPPGEAKAVRLAIQLAEKASAGAILKDPNPVLLAAHEACLTPPGVGPAFKATHAAFSVALAAAGAHDATAATDPIEAQDYDRGSAVQAFLACYHAAQATVRDQSAWIAFTMELQLDYDWLLEKARQEHWTDCTPVPTEAVGSLWPQGEPAGWFNG